MADIKTFDDWITKISQIFTERVTQLMAGKSGKWFIQHFDGWTDLTKKVSCDEHSQAYIQQSDNLSNTEIHAPMVQKMRAEFLAGTERDLYALMKTNRLSFYRFQVGQLSFLSKNLVACRQRVQYSEAMNSKIST